MILRRSSRTDPRLVLGSALVFVLPFSAELGANSLAFCANATQPCAAQNPAPPSTVHPHRASAPPATPAAPASNSDALKQRDQELNAALARQRDSTQTQLKLRAEIAVLSQDRRKFNQQLIDTAAKIRDVEANIDATRARLAPLDTQERSFRKSLDERRATIVEILAALERIGRQPPPALMVRPEDALQAVRTAITLGAVLPEMREEADALAGDLADLVNVRKDIAAENDRLSGDLDLLGREQLRMTLLIDARQRNQAAAEQQLSTEQQQATDLAHQVDSIKDLIGKLETSMDPSVRAALDANRTIEQDATRPDLAALGDPGRLAPAVAFAEYARPAATTRKWFPNPGIRRFRWRRRNPKGAVHCRAPGRTDHRALRRLGGLRRAVSRLWASLDP